MDITSKQAFIATLEFKDADGVDTAAPDAIVWSVDHPELATIEPSADGMSCTITANPGVEGAMIITATSGTLSANSDINIVKPAPGPAVTITMTIHISA